MVRVWVMRLSAGMEHNITEMRFNNVRHIWAVQLDQEWPARRKLYFENHHCLQHTWKEENHKIYTNSWNIWLKNLTLDGNEAYQTFSFCARFLWLDKLGSLKFFFEWLVDYNQGYKWLVLIDGQFSIDDWNPILTDWH